MATSPTPMPTASTGPIPRVEFIWAASRHSIPTATVDALAMIAGLARGSA